MDGIDISRKMTHFAMMQKMIIEQSTQRCCFHIKPSLRLVLTTLPLQPLRVLSSRARRRPDITASKDLATGLLRTPSFSQASEKAYEEDRRQISKVGESEVEVDFTFARSTGIGQVAWQYLLLFLCPLYSWPGNSPIVGPCLLRNRCRDVISTYS